MDSIIALFGLAGVVIAGILSVLVILLPIFVAFGYGELRRIRKAIEKE